MDKDNKTSDIESKSFKELLHESFKSDDTEEWLDVHFTRPIGLFFARIWYRLGVSPNSVTILSIFLGLAAAVMFYFTDTLHNIIGMLLLMTANFCDSTDGQLARLTGKTSMKGRCLDGFAGDVWFFGIYLAIALRLWNQSIPGLDVHWGIWGLAFCFAAGVMCHSPQSSLSDYYRQIHLLFLKGEGGTELGSSKREHAIMESLKGKENVFWDKAFHSNYERYCRSQEHRTASFQRMMAAIKERYGSVEAMPAELKREFLDGSRPLMPMTNILTFNTRAICIYFTALLPVGIGCPWVYLLIEITVLHMLYLYMRKRHEMLCRKITSKVKNEE